MQTKQRSLIIEAVRNVVIVVAIYMSIWLSGFHDTDRRWTLLICLFGMWGAFLLGRSSGPRVRAAANINVAEGEMSQRRVALPDWAWAAAALLIVAVGLLIRFST